MFQEGKKQVLGIDFVMFELNMARDVIITWQSYNIYLIIDLPKTWKYCR